jgi:hypothetical protein
MKPMILAIAFVGALASMPASAQYGGYGGGGYGGGGYGGGGGGYGGGGYGGRGGWGDDDEDYRPRRRRGGHYGGPGTPYHPGQGIAWVCVTPGGRCPSYNPAPGAPCSCTIPGWGAAPGRTVRN